MSIYLSARIAEDQNSRPIPSKFATNIALGRYRCTAMTPAYNGQLVRVVSRAAGRTLAEEELGRIRPIWGRISMNFDFILIYLTVIEVTDINIPSKRRVWESCASSWYRLMGFCSSCLTKEVLTTYSNHGREARSGFQTVSTNNYVEIFFNSPQKSVKPNTVRFIGYNIYRTE